MIRIAISRAAFEAIKSTLRQGAQLDDSLEQLEDGRVRIWLPKGVANALADLRRPGETYDDVIMKIVEAHG